MALVPVSSDTANALKDGPADLFTKSGTQMAGIVGVIHTLKTCQHAQNLQNFGLELLVKVLQQENQLSEARKAQDAINNLQACEVVRHCCSAATHSKPTRGAVA